jgi:hypothetical protein
MNFLHINEKFNSLLNITENIQPERDAGTKNSLMAFAYFKFKAIPTSCKNQAIKAASAE